MHKESNTFYDDHPDGYVTLSASNARDLFGRIFASAHDDVVFDIPCPVIKRLRAAADRWDGAWVEDVSLSAVWADGDEASVFKFSPTLVEDLLAIRAAKLRGPLVF